MSMGDIRKINKADKFYPGLLKELAHPPAQLFIRGNIQALAVPAVAIVGTRRVSREGAALTERLAQDLARAGLAVISGLAFGADAAAHEGALAAKGTTIGVLASGLENISPRSHETLAKRIVAGGGAMVSEYAPTDTAFQSRFLERNRIIAGLSLATLVTEAPARSGALTTARYAHLLQRPLFALPGSPLSANCAGTNALIQRGKAQLVTSARDILRALDWHGGPQDKTGQARRLPQTADSSQIIVQALKNGARDIDNLANITKLAIVTLTEHLTDLELAGRVKDIGNKTYVLTE